MKWVQRWRGGVTCEWNKSFFYIENTSVRRRKHFSRTATCEALSCFCSRSCTFFFFFFFFVESWKQYKIWDFIKSLLTIDILRINYSKNISHIILLLCNIMISDSIDMNFVSWKVKIINSKQKYNHTQNECLPKKRRVSVPVIGFLQAFKCPVTETCLLLRGHSNCGTLILHAEKPIK